MCVRLWMQGALSPNSTWLDTTRLVFFELIPTWHARNIKKRKHAVWVRDYLTKAVFETLRHVRRDKPSCAKQIFLGQNSLAETACRAMSCDSFCVEPSGIWAWLSLRLTDDLLFYSVVFILGVTVTSFYIRRHVGGTQLLHQCYVIYIPTYVFSKTCVNYRPYTVRNACFANNFGIRNVRFPAF